MVGQFSKPVDNLYDLLHLRVWKELIRIDAVALLGKVYVDFRQVVLDRRVFDMRQKLSSLTHQMTSVP